MFSEGMNELIIHKCSKNASSLTLKVQNFLSYFKFIYAALKYIGTWWGAVSKTIHFLSS